MEGDDPCLLVVGEPVIARDQRVVLRIGPTFGPAFSASTCNAMGHVETPELLRLLESAGGYRLRGRLSKLNVTGLNPVSRSRRRS